MKKLVSLKLSKLSVPTKIENGRHYVSTMTGNPNFTTPTPTLANVTTAVNNLEIAYNNALGGGKVLTAIMHDKELIFDNLVTLLSHYVEATANGSESVILSAGMEIKGPGGRVARVFAVTKGKQPGELKLSTKFYSSHAYIWQMVSDPLPDETEAVDPEHTWEQIGVTAKASFKVEDLEIGEKYWFRVASVGKDGQNPWSDPIGRMVSE